MKKKVLGLILLIVVMGAIGTVSLLKQNMPKEIRVKGYLGGEKIGFLEDAEVQEILEEKYGIAADYARAGSLDMVTADLTGMDYLFPSSSTALEYYQDLHGDPRRSEILLNTPIVLYTHKIVLDAFQKQGIAEEREGVWYLDMEKLTELLEEGATWEEIGLPELYGTVSVDTTDPSRSNSGNMFSALLANVLNGGEVVTVQSLPDILPRLQKIFENLGYMETSSSDLFSQFLRMGVGAKPLIAGYESQLIEYAAENPEEWETVKGDIRMVYPTPTVWSSHVLLALDEKGDAFTDALMDEEIQELAWEKHGFRTAEYLAPSGTKTVTLEGVADSLTQITQIPTYEVMREIIENL